MKEISLESHGVYSLHSRYLAELGFQCRAVWCPFHALNHIMLPPSLELRTWSLSLGSLGGEAEGDQRVKWRRVILSKWKYLQPHCCCLRNGWLAVRWWNGEVRRGEQGRLDVSHWAGLGANFFPNRISLHFHSSPTVPRSMIPGAVIPK